MSEIEDRIRRAKAILEFDTELMPEVRALEAREQRMRRASQWGNTLTWEEKQPLLDELEAIGAERKRLRQAAQYQWNLHHPDLDAPSFSHWAIRKRVSRRKPFMEFKRGLPHTVLSPELQDILDYVDDRIEELI